MNGTGKVATFVPMLMTAGFFIHLINVSRYLLTGHSAVADILTWPVDLCLTLLMAYCAVALIARRRAMVAAFDLTPLPRRVGYWVITFYITASLPGHLLFLTTGNSAYFEAFPWWFSLVIMPVYVVMTVYFLLLRPATGALEHARAEHHSGAQR